MRFLLLLLATRLLALPGPAPKGLWQCYLDVEGRQVAFRMEFSGDSKSFSGSILDGETRVTSTSGSFVDSKLALVWDYYDSRLEAVLQGEKLSGNYIRRTKTGPVSRSFSARPYSRPTQVSPASPTASIAGVWRFHLDVATRVNAMDGTFSQSGDEISGTMQRVDGDFGTLEGSIKGDHITLSHFDGVRATFVEMKLTPQGTLEGMIDGRTSFTAARLERAKALGLPEPPDPSRYTGVINPAEALSFRFQDLDGNWVSTEDARFAGKPIVVTIMGSWCPNCHDEAEALSTLYRKYNPQGLEIIALGFEYSGEPTTGRAQLRAFNRRHNVPYVTLLAGSTAEGEVPRKLPQLSDFGSFPTTIWLDRAHRAASIHAGFAGPANPEEHRRLLEEMDSLARRLLAPAR